MKTHACWSAALVAACAVAAALGYLLTDRVPRPGDSLQDAQRLSRQLDGQLAGVRQSTAAREAVTVDVIAGRITLFEAAATFQALDASKPDFLGEEFRRTYPGDSDGERYCRCVLHWVESRLPEGPSSAGQVLTRLEDELAAHLRRHGAVLLPPAVSTH